MKILLVQLSTLHTSKLDAEEVRGTCIYVSSKYKSSELKLENHNFTDSISVEITGQNQSKIIVSCIYRSGSPQKAIQKDEEMHKLIRSIVDAPGYKMKVLVGDFNLNKIAWDLQIQNCPLFSLRTLQSTNLWNVTGLH